MNDSTMFSIVDTDELNMSCRFTGMNLKVQGATNVHISSSNASVGRKSLRKKGEQQICRDMNCEDVLMWG